MILKNAVIFSDSCIFQPGIIRIQNDYIVEINYHDSFSYSPNEEIIDASGMYVIPGLTDIHFHGCVGFDFCDASHQAIQTIANYELQNGITQICPATMSYSEEYLSKIFRIAHDYSSNEGSVLCGINMEGPFLSSAKAGAQNTSFLCPPDVSMFQRLQSISGGLIKIVALAVELPGAQTFIDQLKDSVILSLAHSSADYETACSFFENGVSHVTHLYNAMTEFLHRSPGVVGAAYDHDAIHAELITDGIHIHPTVVHTAFQLFTDERLILISDSMRATGLADGEYTLGGQNVIVNYKSATLSNGTLAGSVTNLFDCMVNAVKNCHIPLASAVKCATRNPAMEIGIYKDYGSITVGKKANMLLIDQELNLKQVIFNGIFQL